MGISIQELLAQDFFREFYVIAGRNGLHKEVQGIAILDAPDGFNWTRGKELVLSTGYVISQEPDALRRAFQAGSMQASAGMMLKRERYIDKLPDDVIALFEQHDVPLISMPFSVPYIDIMNQINTAVMNRTIRRLRILTDDIFQLSDLSYREKKIRQILEAVESDMHFPALIYDLNDQKSFYSSDAFPRISEEYGLTVTDFWEPSLPYAKNTLCDYIHMTRYRLVEPPDSDMPRVSWITIPITMNGVVQAWFVVMESRELLDFYDEYSIRISYLVLHSVYEQIVAAQNLGQLGFENYIIMALDEDMRGSARLDYQAQRHDISAKNRYQTVLFRQVGTREARHERKQFELAFRHCGVQQKDRMVFLDENEGLLFFDLTDQPHKTREQLETMLDLFLKNVSERLPGMELEFSASLEETTLADLHCSVEKCRRVMEMGKIMFSERTAWFYEDLGPLAWLDIPAGELQHMLEDFRELMQDTKNTELLRTLKIYLENNMSFSTTAQQQYLHINTVRNRIDRINTLIPIDWDDPVSRLRVEILLRFLDL